MMIYYFYLLFMLSIFFFSFFIFIYKYKHLLLMLLSLESVVLSIFFLLFFYLASFSFECFLSMIYLTMSVCESALGLSLLILIIRTHSNDTIMMFDNLW
uniref:NADH-ubiquinone oxidoreductase chain 4L n=1 Tax=Melanobaris laticollis TaxID=1069881 RepID=J9PHR0_9CUCU|nr:NADH dehydrogenase subunit 4L [Melanobaris laticollis]